MSEMEQERKDSRNGTAAVSRAVNAPNEGRRRVSMGDATSRSLDSHPRVPSNHGIILRAANNSRNRAETKHARGRGERLEIYADSRATLARQLALC